MTSEDYENGMEDHVGAANEHDYNDAVSHDGDHEEGDPALEFADYSFKKIPRDNFVRKFCIRIVLNP